MLGKDAFFILPCDNSAAVTIAYRNDGYTAWAIAILERDTDRSGYYYDEDNRGQKPAVFLSLRYNGSRASMGEPPGAICLVR